MTLSVHRIADTGLGNSAWLVDLGDGSALAVDPSRDPGEPLELAEKLGLRIRWVVETHLHADFVSGAGELVAAVPGVTRLAPADAALEPPHEPVADSEERDLGGLTLQVLSTPGHTPEHVSYVLLDDRRPQALFSGGTLIVDGVARPDLISPERTEPLARAAWRSITGTMLQLPDEVPVYPTHGGGSFCSAGSGDQPSTTIGEQRRSNRLLQVGDEDGFVDELLGGLSSFPPYFLRLRDVNRRGPRLYGTDTPRLDPLAPSVVAERITDGAQLIDVRPVDRYADAHVAGSLSIELRDSFATWLGWLIDDPDTPLLFVVDDDQDTDDLVRQCLKIGYEHLVGHLAGGIPGWRAAGHDTVATPLTDTPRTDATVLDVRQRSEWEAGHIADATHVELGNIASAAGDLPDGPLVTHCMHGQRSMTAASLLERAGRDDVAVFSGGPDEWRQAIRRGA
ncbi:MAG: MBL fold metallo-hydrolase [Actinobacteria bacterium]|nr:MBL fold metallo-hydrolase [Actinomycetota bacterium]